MACCRTACLRLLEELELSDKQSKRFAQAKSVCLSLQVKNNEQLESSFGRNEEVKDCCVL